MPDEHIPGPTPTGYQRTSGGKGFKWQPPSAEHLSKLLPQYEIESILGYGGMGAVYKGKQKSLDRAVAVKILPPEVDDEDASYVERFKNEAKVMAKFTHPAIVAVYDFGETTEGQLYIVMEYVDGTDVQKMLQSQGRLPAEHALAITAHVCDALAYAHKNGVIHRDIKPANILINMEGAVKVADFGLAKAEEAGASGLTKSGMAMGTPDYVAPETLVMGVNVDGRADLYAVGVMLYAMLTGNVPRGAFKPASVMIREIDPRFDNIVQKAMQMDREERYQSAAEIRRDLDVILTTPLVQEGGKSSAAIPKAAVAQKPVAKGPQKPMGKSANVPVRGGAVVGQARRLPDSEEAAGAAALQSQPAKSKSLAWVVPTFISAIVILGGAFMMRGKVVITPADETPSPAKKAITSAPIKVREEPKPAPGTAHSSTPTKANPPIAKLAALPAPSRTSDPDKWKPVFPDAPLIDGAIVLPTGKSLVAPDEVHFHNGAVRVVLRRKEINQELLMRLRDDGDFRYALSIGKTGGGSLKLLKQYETQSGGLFDLPPPNAQDEYHVEFVAVEDVLGVIINGKQVAALKDATQKEGGVAFFGDGTRIRNVVWQSFDEAVPVKAGEPKPAVASTSPTPSVSSSPSLPISASSEKFPPGQWVKVFTKFEDLPADLRKPGSGVRFEDGWLNLGSKQVWLRFPASLSTNYGIRARFRHRKNAFGSIVLRRQEASKSALYQLRYLENSLNCQRRDDATYHDIRAIAVRKTPQSENESTLEFAVVGSRLIGRLDLDAFATGIDATHATGVAHIYGDEDIRDIEVINLDGIPEAEALRIIGVDEKGNDTRAAALAAEKLAMEQKQVAQAAASIPELATLDEQFKKLTAERVSAPFEAEVAKLNTGYLGGLDRKIAEEKAAGHLDGVIALEAEKKLIAVAGVSDPGTPGSLSRATTMPIPAEDDDATPANLKGLRKIYRDAFAKLEATRAANLKALTDPLTTRFKTLESDLTRKDRIADAKTVREYREKLGQASADTPARNAGAGSATGRTTETPKGAASAQQPARVKHDPAKSRQAAEYALSRGASVLVLQDGMSFSGDSSDEFIKPGQDLPKGKWQLHTVWFPRDLTLTDQDLEAVTQASELKRFIVSTPCPNGTFTSLQPFNRTPSLTHLYLFGGPPNPTDEDAATLEALGESLTRLDWLGTGPTIKVSPRLAQAIGSMKKLQAFNLSGLALHDEDLKQFSELPDLIIFGVNSPEISDAGIMHLSGLKKLESLLFPITSGITPGRVTGASIKSLAKVWKGTLKLINFGHEKSPHNDSILEVLPQDYPNITNVSMRGPASAASIAGLQKLKNLHTFAAHHCVTTPGHAAAIAGLKELKEIRTLSLGTLSAADVASWKQLKNLEVVEFGSKFPLDDAAALEFGAIKSLKSLILPEATVSLATAEALRAKLPGCKITLVK